MEDPAQEWNRLTELYRAKSDAELELLAADAYDLTEIAQQVLAAEISSRKLDVKLNYERPRDESEEEPAPSNSDLASLCWSSDRIEASRINDALEAAGIPCFIGERSVQAIGDYRGSWDREVEFKVLSCDFRRAKEVLKALFPENESEEAEISEAAATCPACRSEEIVFLSRDPRDPSKFRWRCDTCGNKWADEGVVQ